MTIATFFTWDFVHASNIFVICIAVTILRRTCLYYTNTDYTTTTEASPTTSCRCSIFAIALSLITLAPLACTVLAAFMLAPLTGVMLPAFQLALLTGVRLCCAWSKMARYLPDVTTDRDEQIEISLPPPSSLPLVLAKRVLGQASSKSRLPFSLPSCPRST